MIKLVIFGQVRGGKNNAPMNAKTKRRYANSTFAAWRDEAIIQIKKQPRPPKPFPGPVHVEMDYYAGDLKRRDLPMLLDAVWHVLEKADVVADDSFLAGHNRGMKFFNHGRSGRPRVELLIYEQESGF